MQPSDKQSPIYPMIPISHTLTLTRTALLNHDRNAKHLLGSISVRRFCSHRPHALCVQSTMNLAKMLPARFEPAHTQNSARLRFTSSVPVLGKRSNTGFGSSLNCSVDQLSHVRILSVSQSVGSIFRWYKIFFKAQLIVCFTIKR